jgi:alcohol dehydrogenase (cytochrome c)
MTFLPTSKHCTRLIRVAVLFMVSVPCLVAQVPAAVESIASVTGSWPTYNGDVSGRRYSDLTQINHANVHSLTLAWAYPTHGPVIKGTPIEVDGVLYFTAPDHVWAVDAETGLRIWDFTRPSEGNHLAQRGVAFYQNKIYFGTPDAHVIALDAHSGKKIWDREIADVKFGYYISVAPLVVKGRLLVGTSGDQTNVPHFLLALDSDTGAEIWRTASLPKPGGPGSETWPDAKTMGQGGGPMWITGTYDAALNLVYWGTGNPHPVLDGKVRPGDNLYTCSILAINPDTGAIVWYFQPSPHDTHDWDAVETPVLFDGDFHGRPRKMLAQASRNGYFFLLDRQTGESLLTTQFVNSNWASAVDKTGPPVRDPAKDPQPDGALVKSTVVGGTSWMPPSFSPQTNLFYVSAEQGYSFWYLVLDANGAPDDHQGGAALSLVNKPVLLAIDYRTGKVRWQRELGSEQGTPGVLTTAGHLLFTGDLAGNLLALDPSDGTVLWHTRGGGSLNNGPMTYELHGRQYVVTAVGDILYAWTLPQN